MNKKQTKLLWIPRILLIAIILVIGIFLLKVEYSDDMIYQLFSLAFITLLSLFTVSFYSPLISGGLLFIVPILMIAIIQPINYDDIVLFGNFNLNLLYPIIMIILSGILLIVFNFYPKIKGYQKK